MTDDIAFPPLHDPAPGELEKRREHLLSEITRDPENGRRRTPSFILPRSRVAALSGAVLALGAGGAAVAVVLSSSSGAKAAPLLVQPIHGSDWSAAVTGSGAPVLTTTVSMQPTTGGPTAIVGGTTSQRELIQEIVAGMQPTVISSIEITGSGNNVALHFTAPQDHWAAAIWENTLISGAFRDRSNAAGESLSVSYYDSEARGASLPPGPSVPLPMATPGDAAAARQLFENAAAKIGVPLDNLTIYQPDGIAVAATLKSDDPASFLLRQMPDFLAAVRARWNRYDGVYVSLVDGSGQTVWETSWNQRISEGSVGSSPDLAGCSPVSNWSGFKTPSCPAG